MNSENVLKAINGIDDDILDELLESLSEEREPKGKEIRWKTALCVIAAVIAVLTLTAAGASLFSPGWWMSPRPIPEENILLLERYMSKNTGLIAEDEQVRIEAAGSVRDGNSVMMGFLVTLKQADSAVIEGSEFPIPGYYFGHCAVRGFGIEGRWGCFYSDTVAGLQENQFLYRYTLTSDRPIPDEITVELRDIGCVNEKGAFAAALEGAWEWTFRYGVAQSGLQAELPEAVAVGRHRYVLESAEISMFGIELALKPEVDSSPLTAEEFEAERNDMLKELLAAFSGVRMVDRDGAEVTLPTPSGGAQTSRDGPDFDGIFRIGIHFPQPIPTEQIQSIIMLDGQIKFTN